jgi:hypothetical protein
LGELLLRGGGSWGNPILAKGKRGLEGRKLEVAYNGLRVGKVAAVKSAKGKVTMRRRRCKCKRAVGEDEVLHLLSKCPELAAARGVFREEVRAGEDKANEDRSKRGLEPRESEWGKWGVLQRHPGAVMGLLKAAGLDGVDDEEGTTRIQYPGAKVASGIAC